MQLGHPAFILTLALLVGVLAQSLARHLRLPSIVLLLAAGLGLGPEGLGWVRPSELDRALYVIVDVAVSVILFEGGLNLQLSRLRREQASIRRLVTWGALITLIGGALAAHTLLAWDWANSLLFGSLVVVTGPTVIGPLVSELRLRPRLATLLEAEGVLIDPIGAILAVLMLEIALASGAFDAVTTGGLALLLRLGFGLVAGGVCGFLMAWLLRTPRLVPEGHENILVLALVLLLYQSCELFVSHSGLPAVTIAGVVVGNLRTLVDRDLREFKDQLSVMLVGLLFVLLAADVTLEQVTALGWPGVLVVVTLVLVVRPLGVFLCTLGSDLPWRERFFAAWIAPRGILAAAFASIVADALGRDGEGGGLELRALVFLTIATTVILAGLTAAPLGRWLGVRLRGREDVAVLGANALGLALGRALRGAAGRVVFLDVNPENARKAEEDGFDVVFGDALKQRAMARAHFESVATAVALTPNDTLNSAFVSRARTIHGVPRALVAGSDLAGGLLDEMNRRGEVDLAFDAPHDLQRWQARARASATEILRLRRAESPQADSEAQPAGEVGGERFVVLAVERDGRVQPMHRGFEARPGDVASVVVHTPEREAALAVLARQGWLPEQGPGPRADAAPRSE